jgi:hypothetical protein
MALCLAVHHRASGDVSSIVNAPILIENDMTKRYLLSEGAAPAQGEGGWTHSPEVVGSDANYYNRAIWRITPSGSGYLIRNEMTNRLILSDGAPVAAPEGGWTHSPKVVGSDANYYNRAIWKITATGNGYLIQNEMTKRYLLSDGATVTTRGSEGGWTHSPKVVGSDANYYNRAIWRVHAP